MFEPDFEGCDYCGYPDYHHPVESAIEEGEILCSEFQGGDG